MEDNLYEPNEEDIKNWVSKGSLGWPEEDWDHYVLIKENDNLVFEFANDAKCEKRLFFLHSLYYFVGRYFTKRERKDLRDRIQNLLDKVDSKSLGDVKDWQLATLALLNDKLEFDSRYWFDYLYFSSEKDQS